MAPPLNINLDSTATAMLAEPRPAIVRRFSISAPATVTVFVGAGSSTVEIRDSSADTYRKLRQEFRKLARQWRRETEHLSMTPPIVCNSNYLRIISLGKPVLPFIVRDLTRTRDHHWLTALAAISGQDPAASASTLDGAVDAWLDWARSNNIG